MSELQRAVEARLSAFRPDTVPPFADLQRRRRRRVLVRGSAATVAAAAAVAAAVIVVPGVLSSQDAVRLQPASSPTLAADENVDRIASLRTDANGRGLVAAYIGGACDKAARLEAAETPSTVDLRLVVRRDPEQACIKVGIGRREAVRLSAPLKGRIVKAQGRRLVPFDGRRLLTPMLPPGYALRGEGGSALGDLNDDPARTQMWSRTYGTPERPPTPQGACGPGPAPLQLSQGPVGAGMYRSPDWTKTGTVQIGAATATVFEGLYVVDGKPINRLGLALQWEAAGGSVSLASEGGCGGDTILGQDELIAIARSLRPPT